MKVALKKRDICLKRPLFLEGLPIADLIIRLRII